MRNVEIKAKVRNLIKILQKAKVLSNSEGQIIKQQDIFYKVQQGRLKMRILEDSSALLIYYERPDLEGPKLSNYEITQVPDCKSMNSVLSKALGILGEVKKVRHLFMVDQTRVHIDDVENLGNFMELEVVLRSEQTAEEGEKIAKDLMKSLGVLEEDLISGAYYDLLQNKN